MPGAAQLLAAAVGTTCVVVDNAVPARTDRIDIAIRSGIGIQPISRTKTKEAAGMVCTIF